MFITLAPDFLQWATLYCVQRCGMSGGYADRLKHYPNKGVCGLPERLDNDRTLRTKLETLVKRVREAKHLVVFTGAGISTAAGIPDFRGPSGIWTKQQAKDKEAKQQAKAKASANRSAKKRGREEELEAAAVGASADIGASEVKSESDAGGSASGTVQGAIDFSSAQPTYTHRALVELSKRGHLKFLVTQNVDGLDQRAGHPRDKMAVLHGCILEEKCAECGHIQLRDTPVETISFKPTGSSCPKCAGVLRDTLLDWEDPLPEDELALSEAHCEQSDLVLALGTSLRIEPAGSLPCLAKSFVLVNLQQTPKDGEASLIVRAPVDMVMRAVMRDGFGIGDF